MSKISDEQKTQLAQAQNTYFAYLNQQDQIDEQTQINQLNLNLKRATLNVLKNVDETEQTYHAIGKAYYTQSKPSLEEQLSKEAEDAEKNLKSLASTKQYVQTKITESEDRLKELLNQMKEQ